MIHVSLPDGFKIEVARGTSILEVAEAIGPRLAEDAVCATVDGQLRDLRECLNEDCTLTLLMPGSPQALEALRHTTSHVMAQAVKRLFPDARLGIGPAIKDGFYYDFDVPQAFNPDDLERIHAEMKRIIDEDLQIERIDTSKGDARTILIRRGEDLKLELLEEIEAKDVTLYKQGEFIDLCRGPHLRSTGQVRHFQLIDIAGAKWKENDRPAAPSAQKTAPAPSAKDQTKIDRPSIAPPPAATPPSPSAGSRLEMALKRYSAALRAIKGYRGLAILSPDGAVLAADTAEEPLEFSNFAAEFNNIISFCNKAATQKGFDQCTGVTLHTKKGIIIMMASDVYKHGNFRFIGLLSPDANGYFMQIQMEKAIPQILATE